MAEGTVATGETLAGWRRAGDVTALGFAPDGGTGNPVPIGGKSAGARTGGLTSPFSLLRMVRNDDHG